ncbi:MAG: 4Fe-4S binding protein [Candidatus Peregrinibacteria bacterium]|nr:4Fe-4S binding protein [Candidatus Peregrinibacteria bacterium]
MSKLPIKDLKKEHETPAKKDISWQDSGNGLLTDAGNSELYGTGKWGAKKVNFCDKNCIKCGMCWPVCPDEAVIYDEKGDMIGIDTDHCKSCGLCIEACPTTKNEDKTKHALFFSDKEEDKF